MQQYQKDFVEFMLATKALKFGEFTLKSGRISPYFFNAGVFNTGQHLCKLGEFYATAIIKNNINFDVLFGPAYKGVPLAAATSIALFQSFNKIAPYSFNRKEPKTHGEGGNIVGHPLTGDILIIDDVISAGTTIREVMTITNTANSTAKNVIVALDRQEKGTGEQSAIQQVEQQFGLTVFSIISLSNIVDYLKTNSDTALIDKIINYQQQYGIL